MNSAPQHKSADIDPLCIHCELALGKTLKAPEVLQMEG